MAPRESDSVGPTTVTHSFKATEKALTLPVLSDAVSEISKITAPIAPYLEEGMRIIKDKAEGSMSESVKDKVGSCVTNLDSLACNGLDQLTATVPALLTPTPALVETTKETASNYVGLIQEYLASFQIAQLGLRLVDSGLAMVESPLSLVSASFSAKVQHVRRHLRVVRRAGAKRAGHPSKQGSVVLQVLDMFQLNFLLGVLGMQLVENPLASSPTKERKVTDDEDSEMDPDYVPSTEESQDSLEYRSETEIEQEESQEVDSDVEELEDCPTTPNCVKVQHKVGKIVSEQLEAGSHVEDELDEEFEISEVECRTPQCVKGEHEGRRFQES